MEAQTDIQTYLEQGKEALSHGDGRKAAIAYAHGAQIEPDHSMVHLGLAEANLALGNLEVVGMAARRVQELEPAGSVNAKIAQALLDLIARRYDRALQSVDGAIEQDPSIAYEHALRSYLLRATGQDYDANLARARAGRLAFGAHFDNCFPPLPMAYAAAYVERPPVASPPPYNGANNGHTAEAPRPEPVPTWSRPNQMQRQMVRTRFALSRYSNLVTMILIGLNVIAYVISVIYPSVVDQFAQYNSAILNNGEYWRLFTAMFLHASIIHIAFNMLSLYFVGSGVEMLYGKWRYLVIYMLSGIAGGLLFLFTAGASGAAVGASGAIFGIFGALGVFYIMNRRALGGAGLNNWIFWIVLNLVFGLVPGSGIALTAHIGGLIAGMILGFFLLPRLGRRV